MDFIHEVVSLPATTLSDDDQKAEAHQKAIAELILTGDIGSLLRAFATDAWTASSVIVDHVWSSDPDWVAIAPTLAPTLASLLEEQDQAAEGQPPAEASALEQEPFVRLCIAKTLACITREPEALDILLREAAAFGDKARDSMRSALGFFKPLEVMPNLIRFLRRACDSNQAAWQVFFASIVYLIDVRFGAYEDRPADAERFLDMTLSLFAEILRTDERLDEWVEEDVVRLVSTRATPLAGGLKPVIAKLGELSGDAANRITWGVYRGVLMGTESNLANRETAAEWVTRHPSEVSEFGGPSAWRVYVNIIRYCREFREWEYRLKAARDLGEYGPTSTRDPLPEDVKEVRDFLEDLSKTADDPDLRKVAIAALAQNRARGKEAAQETPISICAIASESPAVLSSECIVHFVEPPRLLIPHNLTVVSSPGETFPVSRMDASQGVSLDPTATRSPDLDLASVSFTTTDPAVQSVRYAARSRAG